MSKEALKLALEALEEQIRMANGWQSPAEAKAITAIKEALAQETPYEVGKKVARDGGGFYKLWGAVSHDSDLPEAQRGYEEALAQPEQEPCGGCGGSGWVSRDPDIGTDQECFVCEGAGVIKPEQEQRNVTEQEHDVLMNSIKASSTVVSKGFLAQPEPCEYCYGTGDVHSNDGEWRGVCICEIGKALAQPAVTESHKQEPVAYAVKTVGGKKWHSIYAVKESSDKWLEYRVKEQAQGETYEQFALYTSPPAQRTWVGLTDKEMLEVVHYSQLDNARAIEAKLKEKNQ